MTDFELPLSKSPHADYATRQRAAHAVAKTVFNDIPRWMHLDLFRSIDLSSDYVNKDDDNWSIDIERECTSHLHEERKAPYHENRGSKTAHYIREYMETYLAYRLFRGHD